MADEIKNTTEDTEVTDVSEENADVTEEAAEEIENAETTEVTAEETANTDGAAETAAEDDESSEKDAEKKESKLVDDIIEIVESTLITVFVIVMIFTYILHPVNVVGESMTNTLAENDRIFMTTVYNGPHYGDIVVINNDMAYLLDENNKVIERDITGSPLKECIIKRVIAEPGQTLDLDPEKGEVIVDGKVLDEPYIRDTINDAGYSFQYPITIPEGYYFVMGDNRRGSSDSRVSDIGLIKKDQIYGKAVMRYSPLKKMKILLF